MRVGIVGAGPIGIELHVALRALGVEVIHFDAAQIGATIEWYPRSARFFSSPERIAIAGLPFLTVDQTKATREEYLTYLRTVVLLHDLPIRTFERVSGIERSADSFTVRTDRSAAPIPVDRLVLAVGDMHAPRRLEIPGEDLPHVSHYFDEPYRYFRRRVLIVGGKNSAVEAALRCHRAGARVTVSYRGVTFPEKSVKPWLLPDLLNQIRTGGIEYLPETRVVEIDRGSASLVQGESGTPVTLEADAVLLLTGYRMDPTLFDLAGVPLGGENGEPTFDPVTMETPVPGLYVAGTCAAGTQRHFRLFIENCHPHVGRITRAITGIDPPFSTEDSSRIARDHPES